MEKYVAGLVYENANEALTESTRHYLHTFRAAGYEVRMVDFRNELNAARFLRHVQKGFVRLAFGLQGVGSRLPTSKGANLWDATKTPFIGVHHDHPCHNPYNHVIDTPYVANIYRFASHLKAREAYLPPTAQLSTYVPIGLLGAQPEPSPVPFAKRQIKYLFVKSGFSLDESWAELAPLPPALQDALRAQTERCHADPNLELCDLIRDAYHAVGFDHTQYQKQFWGHVMWLDRFMRRSRAIDFVNWLKCQDEALIVGDGWDFIDKTNARAIFKPAQSGSTCLALGQEARFVCNVNPYGPDIVHERVMLGLVQGACVISDANAWWEAQFADVPALIRFDWAQPLAQQIESKTQDEEAAARAASSARATALSRFAPTDVAPILSLAAKMTT